MMGYSTWVVIVFLFTSITHSYSVGSNILQSSRFIQRRNNSNGINNEDNWSSKKSESSNERISEKKCREYQYEHSHSKLLGTDDIPKSECSLSIDSRISGGRGVLGEDFPHMVALGWFEKHLKFIHRCGGSLISEKWILTAAHCTDNFLKKRGVARLGISRLSAIRSGVIIGVVKIIRHPNYKHPRLYGDIALMELARGVKLSDKIKPACLYSSLGVLPEVVSATGWGSLEFGNEQVQDNLRMVKLKTIDTLTCALAYNQTIAIPHGIVPSMLCAGDPQGGWKGDTCRGDSGGPLQIFNAKNCAHVIVGITSFGKLCGTPEFPGVYTRVAYYLDWIESIVWP